MLQYLKNYYKKFHSGSHNYISDGIQNLNYSKIFQMAKGQKGQVDTNNTTTNTGLA